jgi:tetratricopeptide (TPR) repeat protein
MKFPGATMIRTALFAAALIIGITIYPGAETWAACMPGGPCISVPPPSSSAGRPAFIPRQPNQPSGPSQEEDEQRQKQAVYNQLYEQGVAARNNEEYEEALRLALQRQQLIDGPNVRTDIAWLNSMIVWKKAHDLNDRGNDAYNAREYARAVSLFAQALKLKPNDTKIAENLKYARAMVGTPESQRAVSNEVDALVAIANSGRPAALAPGLNFTPTDPSVVDARNVWSGLPASIEAEIPHTPAGDRIHKGFVVLKDKDWPAAHGWFLDALNHDPGNPGIQRLIDLAEYNMNYAKQPHQAAAPASSKPVTDTSAQDKAAMARLDRQLEDAFWARSLDDFNRNYIPKAPDVKSPPAKLTANWKAFFDDLFGPSGLSRQPTSVSGVRD